MESWKLSNIPSNNKEHRKNTLLYWWCGWWIYCWFPSPIIMGAYRIWVKIVPMPWGRWLDSDPREGCHRGDRWDQDLKYILSNSTHVPMDPNHQGKFSENCAGLLIKFSKVLTKIESIEWVISSLHKINMLHVVSERLTVCAFRGDKFSAN